MEFLNAPPIEPIVWPSWWSFASSPPSRQLNRGNLLGRLHKQIADLYLLLGQLQQAGNWYRTASVDLKHHKDWLWVGGAYEGLSVTALVTKECERVLGQKAQGVEAPSSLSKLKGKVGMLFLSCDFTTWVM